MNKYVGALCVVLGIVVSGVSYAQELTPGLEGMAPMKWMSFKTTHAPGRVYQSLNSQSSMYTQEDVYFRAWIPIVAKSKFALALGPHYRSEQLEIKGAENPMSTLSSWQLRSLGVDMKSLVKLDSSSWLITAGQVNQSGNLHSPSRSNIPLSYTLSAVYLHKKSINKEVGFGLMLNKSNAWMVLPVFVYNYNFSSRSGLEVSLPHRVSWRHNLSSRDILYLKSEAVTRTYFINSSADVAPEVFRRIDVDMGIAYNKQLTSFMGVELFAGYRQNVSYELPVGVTAVKNSGWVASFELYIRPPKGLRLRKE